MKKMMTPKIMVGINPEAGVFVGADPVLNNPTRFFISKEFKEHDVKKIHQDGWHYFPPFEGDDQDIVDQFMEDVGPEDLGVSEPIQQLEARSRYKSEYDKAIKKLLDKGMRIKDAIIELAPQWGNQPYKGFNYKMANRGGLMSLV